MIRRPGGRKREDKGRKDVSLSLSAALKEADGLSAGCSHPWSQPSASFSLQHTPAHTASCQALTVCRFEYSVGATRVSVSLTDHLTAALGIY